MKYVNFTAASARRVNAALIAATLFGLSACADLKAHKDVVDSATAKVVELRATAAERAVTGASSWSEKPRFAGEEVALVEREMLPSWMNKAYSFHTRGSQTLREVIADIEEDKGLVIKTDAFSGANNGQAATGVGGRPADIGNTKMELAWSESFKGLLTHLANLYQSNWRYANGVVEFFQFETKTFSVGIAAGKKDIAAAINLGGVTGGGGSSSGGGGQVSVSSSATINPYANVIAAVGNILAEGNTQTAGSSTPAGGAAGGASLSVSGPNGRASANPDLGTITVTARPAQMAAIESYIKSVSQKLGQNVLIDLKVFNLTLSTQSQLGFNLDTFYKNLGGYGVSIASAAAAVGGGANPGTLTLGAAGGNSRWNGSQVVFQALQQQGDVALQLQQLVVATNGQPSPIQLADQIGYIASSTVAQTANVGTTCSVTPGSVTVGFTGNFLPLMLGDNRILLQYQMQMSSAVINQVGQGTPGCPGASTPTVTSQMLQQSAYLKDGQAIVLFGFDQDRKTVNAVDSAGGISRGAGTKRQMVVVVMQVFGGQNDQ